MSNLKKLLTKSLSFNSFEDFKMSLDKLFVEHKKTQTLSSQIKINPFDVHSEKKVNKNITKQKLLHHYLFLDYSNSHTLMELLYEHCLIEKVIPYYINTYANNPKDSLQIILDLFTFKDKKGQPLLHSRIDNILDYINPSILSKNEHWSFTSTTELIASSVIPLSIVKKHKIMQSFVYSIDFSDLLRSINKYKNAELFSELFKQNINTLIEALPGGLYWVDNISQHTEIENHLEPMFLKEYISLSKEQQEFIKKEFSTLHPDEASEIRDYLHYLLLSMNKIDNYNQLKDSLYQNNQDNITQNNKKAKI